MKFTEEQQKVIDLREGQHLVLAPAGTGKTAVLVERVLNGIENNLDQSKMACLTFTNRASQNMIDRVKKRSLKTPTFFIGSIHHFSHLFLNKFEVIPKNATLLDEEDLRAILSEIISAESYNTKTTSIGNLTKINTFIKGEKLGIPTDILLSPDEPYSTVEFNICKKYEELKAESNFVDFDDLILLTYKHLADNPETNNLFNWLQVDEVQDLNRLQWAIIEKISSSTFSHRVFFGDFEQAIFSFMGADINILNHIKNSSTVHYFTHNFRSPQYLLNLFNEFAEINLKRSLDNQLVSKNLLKKVDNSLRLEGAMNNNQEVDWIVHNLKQETSSAILVRTNKDADKFARALDKVGIEFFKLSGVDIFRQPVIKDLMAFLNILIRPHNKTSWIRNLKLFGEIGHISNTIEILNQMYKIGFRPLDFINLDYLQTYFNSFQNDRIVVFDTEATGLNTAEDEIIQIAGVEVINGKVGKTFEVFLKTEKDVSSSENIHKISNQFLKENGIDRVDGLQKFIKFIDGAVLVAHNINYDLSILQSNLRKVNLPEIKPKYFFDSIEIAQRIHPTLHSYKLESLLKTLNIAGKNSHNALDDVKATVNLLLSFVQPFEKLQKPRENFKQQYSEMLSNFRENFKPLYDAITGQFSEDISTAEIITMILDYLQNQLGYRINQFILDEVDGKILKHLNSNNLENKSLYSRLKEQIPRYSRYSESDLLLGNERVVIATIHKSKGLEFETVVVPDVVEDVFPNFYSKEEEKILEDARLLYVAITRAKQKLWLTFSEIKPIETKKGIWNKPQHLSRFLTGINWSKHII